MMWLGMSGKCGTGKDTIARIFQKQLQNYFKKRSLLLAFADTLKMECIQEQKLSFHDAFFEKNENVRKILQDVGNEARLKNKNHWIDRFNNHVECLFLRNEIDIVRFPNEVEFVREKGGHVIRIIAPNRARLALSNATLAGHTSEVSLDHHTFDFEIFNDAEQERIVENQCLSILSEIFNEQK